VEDRGPSSQGLLGQTDYVRLQNSIAVMSIEISSLREQLFILQDERWDSNLVLSGLIGGIIFVALSVATGLWIMSVIGAGLCFLAIIHQFGFGKPFEWDRSRISKRDQNQD
jgi:hypothetical protein